MSLDVSEPHAIVAFFLQKKHTFLKGTSRYCVLFWQGLQKLGGSYDRLKLIRLRMLDETELSIVQMYFFTDSSKHGCFCRRGKHALCLVSKSWQRKMTSSDSLNLLTACCLMYSLSSHHSRLVLCFHSYCVSSDSAATNLHRWAFGTKICAEWACRDGKIADYAKSEFSSHYFSALPNGFW